MPRLFIAIDLPDRVTEALAALRNDALDVRWVDPEKIHLTLRFLGDVPPDRIPPLKESLQAITAQSFELQPGGLGVFPSRRSPSVLWVGLADSPPLMQLQEQVEETAVARGFEPEARSYTPHLTVARCRDADPREIRTFMQARPDFSTDAFEVTAYHLYESELHPEGARYSVRASFGLTAENGGKPAR